MPSRAFHVLDTPRLKPQGYRKVIELPAPPFVLSLSKGRRQARKMESIFIWADRPPGSDPTTHFWFEESGVRYRICDGTRWAEGRGVDNPPDFAVPCNSCIEIYLEDVLRGLRLLHLSPESPPVLPQVHPLELVEGASFSVAHPLAKWGDTPYYRVSTLEKEGTSANATHRTPEILEARLHDMLKVPIGSFARFYEARPADQVRIVRDIRNRLVDPEGYTQRDYYHQLRVGLRKTHWSTGDISTLDSARETFLGIVHEHKRDHYRAILDSYIDLWMVGDRSCFRIKSVDVEVGALTIGVTPEVGMRIGADSYALKLWFNSKPPTRPARQVINYAMDRASKVSDDWDQDWNLAIWDVRRKHILPPLRVARDFELGLMGQIAAFLQIWDELDRRGMDFDE